MSGNENFRWGIIGTGGIARTFARDIAYLEGHEIAAVGSRTILKSQEFTNEFPATPFGSYEELVASDVDAIYVATPHSLHAENSILALNAGKPVLCEKPFAVNAAQAEAMMRRAGIRWLSTTTKSIEEIATTILQEIRPQSLTY